MDVVTRIMFSFDQLASIEPVTIYVKCAKPPQGSFPQQAMAGLKAKSFLPIASLIAELNTDVIPISNRHHVLEGCNCAR